MELPTWLKTSLNPKAATNMDINGGSTLRLFDDSPVLNKELQIAATSSNGSATDPQVSWLSKELERVREENKKLNEMLAMVGSKYNALRAQMADLIANNDNNNKTASSGSKKRKSPDHSSNNNKMGTGESSSSEEENDSCTKKAAREPESRVTMISKAYVKTEASDTSLIVKDGYQWRKYGQKVTRDNPSPRAYFRCSFAPRCLVKKKVQRSLEDQSILVAIYEGEHNHPPPVQPLDSASAAATRTHQCTVSSGPATVTLDLTKPELMPFTVVESNGKAPEFQKLMAEEMACSLTKDQSFTDALAAAISARFLQDSKDRSGLGRDPNEGRK